MSQPILVTGTAGEAGRFTTQLLLEQRFEVRALVHRADGRSDKPRANGAEVVVGDLFDFDSVHSALKDLNAGYFVYPIQLGLMTPQHISRSLRKPPTSTAS